MKSSDIFTVITMAAFAINVLLLPATSPEAKCIATDPSSANIGAGPPLPTGCMAYNFVLMAVPSSKLNTTSYCRPSLHHRQPVCNFSDDFHHICVFVFTLYFIYVIYWQKHQRGITGISNLPSGDRYLLCMCHLRGISMINIMQWLMLRFSTCVLNLCEWLPRATMQSLGNYLQLSLCRYASYYLL